MWIEDEGQASVCAYIESTHGENVNYLIVNARLCGLTKNPDSRTE